VYSIFTAEYSRELPAYQWKQKCHVAVLDMLKLQLTGMALHQGIPFEIT
jgi:hypothetical protein